MALSPSLRVLKKETPVVIYTATHKIEGIYHAHEGVRLLDDLNGKSAKQFFPLTDVKVTSLQGEGRVVFESDFAAINVHDITLLCPSPRPPRA
ncbi:MAG: hypothetical protein QN178_12835 [Armatimonadota bacterium]|nr:hypothetical protein [Armatimonadota bacterium]